jgi:hypothetical protein
LSCVVVLISMGVLLGWVILIGINLNQLLGV